MGDAPREAVLGEVMQGLGATNPDHGWFILGVNGYFDVDNACWCEHQEGDAPWTSEWFRLLGTLPQLHAQLTKAQDALDAYLCDPPPPIGNDVIADLNDRYAAARESEQQAWREVERLREDLAEATSDGGETDV